MYSKIFFYLRSNCTKHLSICFDQGFLWHHVYLHYYLTYIKHLHLINLQLSIMIFTPETTQVANARRYKFPSKSQSSYLATTWQKHRWKQKTLGIGDMTSPCVRTGLQHDSFLYCKTQLKITWKPLPQVPKYIFFLHTMFSQVNVNIKFVKVNIQIRCKKMSL